MVEMHQKNVSAYIGPEGTCVTEARLASALNRPMIGYVSYCSLTSSNGRKGQ